MHRPFSSIKDLDHAQCVALLASCSLPDVQASHLAFAEQALDYSRRGSARRRLIDFVSSRHCHFPLMPWGVADMLDAAVCSALSYGDFECSMSSTNCVSTLTFFSLLVVGQSAYTGHEFSCTPHAAMLLASNRAVDAGDAIFTAARLGEMFAKSGLTGGKRAMQWYVDFSSQRSGTARRDLASVEMLDHLFVFGDDTGRWHEYLSSRITM